MKTLVITLSVILLVSLSGCASLMKPVFTDNHYTELGRGIYALYTCGKTGRMSQDTAAMGIRNVKENMADYQYDKERFDREINSQYGDISQEDCNLLSIQVKQGASRNLNSNSAPAQTYQTPIYKPTNTYCNRIGNSTFCNSY